MRPLSVLLAAAFVLAACNSTPGSQGTTGGGGSGPTTTTTKTKAPDAGKPPIAGSPCTKDGDCVEGKCFTETGDGYPSGYCSGTCSPKNPATCADPTQELCIPTSVPGQGLCRTKCNPMASVCRDGYVCVPLGAQGFCSPACKTDAQCPTVGHCNPPSGYCKP